MITEEQKVAGLLSEAILEFWNELDKVNAEEVERAHGCVVPPLEIDSDCEDVEGKPYLKVINHTYQDAYAVYLDTIVAHHKDGILKDLVRALRTGEFIRLNGITRIVGYYSRIQNWNKSKVGELKDRHEGNYLWKKWSSADTLPTPPAERAGFSYIEDLCHA